jgi:hypothetical protein
MGAIDATVSGGCLLWGDANFGIPRMTRQVVQTTRVPRFQERCPAWTAIREAERPLGASVVGCVNATVLGPGY